MDHPFQQTTQGFEQRYVHNQIDFLLVYFPSSFEIFPIIVANKIINNCKFSGVNHLSTKVIILYFLYFIQLFLRDFFSYQTERLIYFLLSSEYPFFLLFF